MNASRSQVSGAIDLLAAFVGIHCAVTRTGEEYEGRGTLTLPGPP